MKTERFGRFLLSVIATSPNWYIPWSMWPGGFGKMPVLLPLILAAGICTFVPPVFGKGNEKNQGNERFSFASLLGASLLFFLGAYLLTSLLGINPWKSVWGELGRQNGFIILSHFVLFALALPRLLKTKEHWAFFERVLVIAAVVPALVAILQSFVPSVAAIFGETHRFSAWFTNPIYLGSYLVLASMIALRLALKAVSGERIALLLGWGIIILGVFATGSRGPVLALLAGLAVTAVVWSFGKLRGKARAAVILGFVLLAGSWLLLVVGTKQSSISACEKYCVQRFLPGPIARIADLSAYVRENRPRLLTWSIAWNAFLDRPLAGWGPENFQTAFDRHYKPELLRYSFYETVSDRPHNYFLEILAGGGILLAATLLFVVAAVALLLTRAMRRGTVSRTEGALIAGFFGAYAVSVAFLFEIPPTSLLLFSTFGYLLSVGSVLEIAPSASLLSRWQAIARFFRRRSVSRIGLALAFGSLLVADAAIAGLALPASFSAVRAKETASAKPEEWAMWAEKVLATPNPYGAELKKILAFDLIRRDGSGAWKREFVKQQVGPFRSALEEEVRRYPDDFTLVFTLGQLTAIAGEYSASPELLTEAIDQFRRARELSPRRQIVPMQLAKVLLIGSKPKEAVFLLQSVVEADPTISEPHWFLGLALAASGDTAAGAAEIQKSLELGRTPSHAREIAYIIDLFAKAERYGDIIPLYEALIGADPENAELHARLAATYAKAGKPELAIAAAQRAAELDPSFRAEADRFIQSLTKPAQ